MKHGEPPSLLYIHSDQHSPFVTGCYGDPLVQTPHLDRLASTGVLFGNAYCTSPICVPSRMSMLTGRHPHENEVWTNQHILDASIPTHAHAMGAAGYRPTLIGRMHALGPDQLHGYAERLVGDHGPNHLGGSAVDRGELSGTAGPDRVSLVKSGAGQSAYQVHDEYVTAAAVDYLDRLGIEKRSGQLRGPFCLTAGFMLPHPPYVARRETYDLYRSQITMPEKPEPLPGELHPHLQWWRQHTGITEVPAEEVLRARAAYWALVTEMDRLIGQILSAVHDNDLADNLLILYTSDHGDMLGEHGLWWKHTFYEESAKVPLILAWPGVIPAGGRCDRIVSALDVTATVLDAVGAPALPNASGQSFLPLISGEDAEWPDRAFSEYCSDEFAPPGGCYQRMIRQGDWKLVYYHGQASQLYDLSDDPGERRDRASDRECRDVRDGLMDLLLDGWNPDEIALKMAAKRADNQVLRAWARGTCPPDQFRWPLKPEMNYLDE